MVVVLAGINFVVRYCLGLSILLSAIKLILSVVNFVLSDKT